MTGLLLSFLRYVFPVKEKKVMCVLIVKREEEAGKPLAETHLYSLDSSLHETWEDR